MSAQITQHVDPEKTIRKLRARVDRLEKALAEQPAQQDSTCNNALRAQGKAYPRTCKKCGLGPCIADRVQPAQQEPVAWMYPDDHELMLTNETFCTVYSVEVGSARGESTVPLYTSPPAQRQPLTDEQIEAVWKVAMFEDNGRHALLDNQPFVHFARAIEAAHGIKETEK